MEKLLKKYKLNRIIQKHFRSHPSKHRRFFNLIWGLAVSAINMFSLLMIANCWLVISVFNWFYFTLNDKKKCFLNHRGSRWIYSIKKFNFIARCYKYDALQTKIKYQPKWHHKYIVCFQNRFYFFINNRTIACVNKTRILPLNFNLKNWKNRTNNKTLSAKISIVLRSCWM